MGWSVMTVWECQLKPAVREKTLSEIEYYINKTFLDRYRQKTKVSYCDRENEMFQNVAEPSAIYGKKKIDLHALLAYVPALKYNVKIMYIGWKLAFL